METPLKDLAENVNLMTASLRAQVYDAKAGYAALEQAVLAGDSEIVSELLPRQKQLLEN